MTRARLLLLGICAGLAAGLLTGVLDAATTRHEFLERRFLFVSAVQWTIVGGVFGLVLGALAAVIARPASPRGLRTAAALAGAITAIPFVLLPSVLVLVVLNASVLPADTDPRSKLVSGGLFVLALGIAALLARGLAGAFTRPPLVLARVVAHPALLLAAPLAALAIAAAAWSGGGGTVGPPASPAPAGSPNVVLVLIDTLRDDALSGGGNPHPVSPWIDRIARGGVTVPELTSASCYTKPSVASLLTSLHPSTHRVGHLRTVLAASTTTLPEIFHDAGYRTAMVCSNTIIGAEFGFAQGAELFATLRPDDTGKTKLGYLLRRLGVERGIAPFAAAGSMLRAVERALPGASDERTINLSADQVVRAFGDWRASLGEDPYFAYLHFMEPHGPYRPPEPYGRRFLADGDVLVDDYPRTPLLFLPFARADSIPAERRRGMIAAYEGEIAALDRTLGRLVGELLADSRPTIVMITADHGEEFHEHGGWGHGHSLLQEQLRIPWVVGGKGVPQGRLVPGDARLVDLAPTIVELAGVSSAVEMSGKSWAPAFRTGAPPPSGEILSEIIYNDTYWSRSLRMGSWKIVKGRLGEDASVQLFDLERDPGEMQDRAGADSAMASALGERLDAVVETAKQGATEQETADFDPVTMERLRALGYVQ